MSGKQYYADMQGKGTERRLKNVGKKILLNEKEGAGEEEFW